MAEVGLTWRKAVGANVSQRQFGGVPGFSFLKN